MMRRVIAITDSYGVQSLGETSLPLMIGADENVHIHVGDGPLVAAYVGESRSHLFLQPAEDLGSFAIFHNDESVTGSVWLKSGDVTRFGSHLVRWHMSGQRVEIKVSHISAEILRPPAAPPDQTIHEKGQPTESPSPPPTLTTPEGGQPKHRVLVTGLFVLLLIAAAFVLLAKPLEISVRPAPERLSVSGFPPVIMVGDRFLGFPGQYVVQAELAGYRPLKMPVTIGNQGGRYTFTLKKLPGLVDVSSEPPGVTLLLDGDTIGTTPLQALEVPIGSHVLGFQHPRYLPEEKTIEIRASGETQTLEVKMRPAWAQVMVQSEPSAASLSVDGEVRGETPVTLELMNGKHQLHFTQKGFTPLETSLEVIAGQDMNPPVYVLEPAQATIRIDSEPAGATVTINGQFRGQTPLSVKLSSGQEYDIRAVAVGYLTASHSVRFAPEEERTLTFKLEPQYGTVFIAPIPPDATLFIDGREQTQATGRFRLTTRPHTLELRRPGYQSATRSITPRAGYSQRLEISLNRASATDQSAKPSQPSLSQQTGLGQSMILIKPMGFVMGASRTEPGRRANENEYQVNLKRSFYISTHEVTNRDFRRFRAEHVSGMAGNRSLDIESHPVVNISWEDAVRFMNWLSAQDGLPPFYQEVDGRMVADNPPGIGYRLPTESEWEYVARQAGRKERSRYPWSGSYPPNIQAGNFADESARHLVPVVIDGYNDSFPGTAPVGSFPANAIGVYDLGGNAAEWCHDYYTAYVAGVAQDRVDPMGATSGTHYVVRGSSWQDASMTELRYSYRRYSREPTNDIGFRIARYAE